MNNKLVARGRMGSYELTEGRKDYFYVPTPIGTEISSKAVSDNLEGIQATLLNFYDEMKKNIEDLRKVEAFPIGSTFISIDDINPKDRLGYGDWVLISEGRTLVGAGAGKVLGTTGGSSTVALTEAQMPSHKHGVSISNFSGSKTTTTNGGTKSTDSKGAHTHTTNGKGARNTEGRTEASLLTTYGGDITNIVANESGAHTHNIDINHSHTVDISHGHGVSESSKGGNAPINIENPYLVVNIWHRVS